MAGNARRPHHQQGREDGEADQGAGDGWRPIISKDEKREKQTRKHVAANATTLVKDREVKEQARKQEVHGAPTVNKENRGEEQHCY